VIKKKKAGAGGRVQIDAELQLPFHTYGPGTAEDAFDRELAFCLADSNPKCNKGA